MALILGDGAYGPLGFDSRRQLPLNIEEMH